MKCFLIDDDQDDREIFAIALSEVNSSYSCITAINGEDALKVLNDQPDFTPDFIFLDLNMPLMNGKTCLTELRKIPRLKQVPIIIYTTSSYSKDIEDTQNLGASHYLVKPSSISSLSNILTSFFEGKTTKFQLNS
ncbi:response regulator [Flavobacterium sp.]|uniref:response regulator n=1 Tax=Flavobacterium sp. TaxID=239 RepID=UPI002CD77871|nr:response regulator [Flavobacterium sp.]HSD06658.1 response regulator [Flavobacterium sp.]